MTSEYATTARPGRNQGDQIIYYRRPFETRDGKPAENAGWITWGDSTSGTKLRDFQIRGFTPLLDLGNAGMINSAVSEHYIKEKIARGESVSEAERVWGPILRHPKGPAMFPVDQIMAFGWYRPENCPVPGVSFPQLKGQKVKEYRCPECRRSPFIDVDGRGGISGLANHLRIMHGFDRANLDSYGERVGIDFSRADTGEALVEEFEIGESQAQQYICDDCGKQFRSEKALSGHMNTHPVVEIETV